MKKFINAVDKVEDQMIQGMVKAYPQYLRKLDCEIGRASCRERV